MDGKIGQWTTNFYSVELDKMTAIMIALWSAVRLMMIVSCFPVLFDLMMALRSIETHSITMKNLALFRPKLSDFFSTNQIARFVNYYC